MFEDLLTFLLKAITLVVCCFFLVAPFLLLLKFLVRKVNMYLLDLHQVKLEKFLELVWLLLVKLEMKIIL